MWASINTCRRHHQPYPISAALPLMTPARSTFSQPLHSLSSVGLQRKNARARTHSCAREGAHFEPVYITLYSEADTGFIILLEKEEEEEE
uniref:Uncharacterized protein n=1 Tax=Mesocestoides corti TaxID=53468 RepID=A0A5K3F6Z7_MESCO